MELDCVPRNIRSLIGAAHELPVAGQLHLHCEGRGPSGGQLYLQHSRGPGGGNCLDAYRRTRDNWVWEGRVEGEKRKGGRERRKEREE